MSYRNIIWMVIVVFLGVILWYVPDITTRRQTIYREFGPLLEVYATIKKSYVEKVDTKELIDGAIDGMINRLDPFCRYIRPEEFDAFNQQISGVVSGIGIFLEIKDGLPTVISPLEDSPAFKAGIMAGDKILAIDGVSTKSKSIYEIINMLSGPVGTAVSLQVRHEYTDTVETINIVRSLIEIRTVKGFARDEDNKWLYFIDPDEKIAYIRITGFLANTASELDEVYTSLLEEGMRALIIDLRWTPGGLLQSAVDIADRFIEDGIIVQTKGRWGQQFVWQATEGNEYRIVPIVILVNQYTASAAEIFSGAMQYYKKAKLIGSRTFGKGSVQSVIPLREHVGVLKLTTAYYYLANGRNIHRRSTSKVWGVDPDIKVELAKDEQIRVLLSRKEVDTVYNDLYRQKRKDDSFQATNNINADNSIAKDGRLTKDNAEDNRDRDKDTIISKNSPVLGKRRLYIDAQMQQALSYLKEILEKREGF